VVSGGGGASSRLLGGAALLADDLNTTLLVVGDAESLDTKFSEQLILWSRQVVVIVYLLVDETSVLLESLAMIVRRPIVSVAACSSPFASACWSS
jgi:hypothetical protein